MAIEAYNKNMPTETTPWTLPRNISRDRLGRFAALRPCCGAWTDEHEVTHSNEHCANVTGELAEGDGGWLCTACVLVETPPAWALQMWMTPKRALAGSGGAKGDAIALVLASNPLWSVKDVANEVGCTVGRVYEVRRALKRVA